jgi:hypothetical protein
MALGSESQVRGTDRLATNLGFPAAAASNIRENLFDLSQSSGIFRQHDEYKGSR